MTKIPPLFPAQSEPGENKQIKEGIRNVRNGYKWKDPLSPSRRYEMQKNIGVNKEIRNSLVLEINGGILYLFI